MWRTSRGDERWEVRCARARERGDRRHSPKGVGAELPNGGLGKSCSMRGRSSCLPLLLPLPLGFPGVFGVIYFSPPPFGGAFPYRRPSAEISMASPRLTAYCVRVWCVLRVLPCTCRSRHLVAQEVGAPLAVLCDARALARRTPKTGPRRSLRPTNPARHPKGPTPNPYTPWPHTLVLVSSSSPKVHLLPHPHASSHPTHPHLATPPPIHFLNRAQSSFASLLPSPPTFASLLPSPPTFARSSAS